MSRPKKVTLRNLRRLAEILKRRQREANPCPDICIVLPHGFGFRPGDRLQARMAKGRVVLTNLSKLTKQQRRKLYYSGKFYSDVENADWSMRLLPCPFCGSRARLWPDVPEAEDHRLGSFTGRIVFRHAVLAKRLAGGGAGCADCAAAEVCQHDGGAAAQEAQDPRLCSELDAGGGCPVEAIQRAGSWRLGRSIKSVQGRRLLLGIKFPNPRRPWPSEDLALLGTLPDAVLAKQFNRPESVVRSKRQQLGRREPAEYE